MKKNIKWILIISKKKTCEASVHYMKQEQIDFGIWTVWHTFLTDFNGISTCLELFHA